jgi:hypothetical protein
MLECWHARGDDRLWRQSPLERRNVWATSNGWLLAGQEVMQAGVAEPVEQHARPRHTLGSVAIYAELMGGRDEVTLGAVQLEVVLAGARV